MVSSALLEVIASRSLKYRRKSVGDKPNFGAHSIYCDVTENQRSKRRMEPIGGQFCQEIRVPDTVESFADVEGNNTVTTKLLKGESLHL